MFGHWLLFWFIDRSARHGPVMRPTEALQVPFARLLQKYENGFQLHFFTRMNKMSDGEEKINEYR
jgi:hypothetical protein